MQADIMGDTLENKENKNNFSNQKEILERDMKGSRESDTIHMRHRLRK